jgi:alkylhydroperoxidase/carboxymuconolactone decarboxylase family protein YurZ
MNSLGQQLLARIREHRGYDPLPFQRELAARHPEMLAAYDDMYRAAMGDGSALSAKMRHLIVMTLDLVLGVGDKAVRGHARRAIEHGATESEVLAAIELATLVSAGKPLAMVGKVFGDDEAAS